MYTCRSRLKTNKRDKKEEYITASGLKQRGWTHKLIKDFAGEPDKYETNPVFKSAKPMKLYLLTRIKRIERTKKFQTAEEKSKKYKEGAQKAAETKKQHTMDYVKGVRIKVPQMTKERLIECACKSYNEFHEEIAIERCDFDFEVATPDSDERFLSRICVNYLRHKCTRYDDDLDRLFGSVGIQEVHDLLRERINNRIFELYPWIDRNCYDY